MKVYVVVKAVGRTRGFERVLVEVDDVGGDVRGWDVSDMIRFFVNREIDRYESDEFRALSQVEIDRMVDNGKISFGFKYRKDEKIDRNEALMVALQAFVDELFVVFVNERQLEGLDEKAALSDGDEISFVRLTMLAGRYW